MSGSAGRSENKNGHILSPVDEQLHFGWLVTDVARLLRTVFDRRVRSFGLTRPQWLALSRLNRRPGASQSELADMMEIEKAPAGRIVDRMEEKGWVERRPEPSDRRINRIHLTDRGQRVYAAILPIAVDTVSDAHLRLSERQRDQMIDLLSNVKITLQALAESDPTPDIEWSEDGEQQSLDARAPQPRTL